jgi:threonine dehydratase
MSENLSVQEGQVLDYSKAVERLKKVIYRTPLTYNQNLSRKYHCKVYLKREDLQVVRSYKLRALTI